MRGMSFFKYFRVNYFRGILPAFGVRIKSVFGCIASWLLYCLPAALVGGIWCMAFSCTFLMIALYCLSRKQSVPNIFNLYPIAPFKKEVYDLFANFIYSVITVALMCVFMFIYTLLGYLIVAMFTGEADFFNTMFGMLNLSYFMGESLWVCAKAALLFASVSLMGFGGATLINARSGKVYRRVTTIAFLIVNAALMVAIAFFALYTWPGEEVAALIIAVTKMPHAALILALYALLAVAVIAAGGVIKLTSVKRF